jgi:hypothetical protein
MLPKIKKSIFIFRMRTAICGFVRLYNATATTNYCGIGSWSQSCDFRIYYYNARVVVFKLECFLNQENIIVLKTRNAFVALYFFTALAL